MGSSIRCLGVAAFRAKRALIVLGRPMMAADLMRASRVRRAIWTCSEFEKLLLELGDDDDDDGEELCLRASSKTLGIWSGRFNVDRVVEAMKYHVFGGREGWLRNVLSNAGVMIVGSDIVRLWLPTAWDNKDDFGCLYHGDATLEPLFRFTVLNEDVCTTKMLLRRIPTSS